MTSVPLPRQVSERPEGTRGSSAPQPGSRARPREGGPRRGLLRNRPGRARRARRQGGRDRGPPLGVHRRRATRGGARPASCYARPRAAIFTSATAPAGRSPLCRPSSLWWQDGQSVTRFRRSKASPPSAMGCRWVSLEPAARAASGTASTVPPEHGRTGSLPVRGGTNHHAGLTRGSALTGSVALTLPARATLAFVRRVKGGATPSEPGWAERRQVFGGRAGQPRHVSESVFGPWPHSIGTVSEVPSRYVAVSDSNARFEHEPPGSS